MAKLRFKPEITQAQKVTELLERFMLRSVDYSQGYQTKPVLRLKPKPNVLGESRTATPDYWTCSSTKRITELLHRMLVKS